MAYHSTPWNGCIEVVVGSMFSGKTEELIRRIKRAQLARQRVQIFKPKIDDRYSEANIHSHSDQKIQAAVVENAADILAQIKDTTRVVGIDEGQFFGPEIVNVAQILANRGVRVIIAGLDTDWRGRPFHPMPELMAVAENVTKQHAVCMSCGGIASRTQRTVKSSEDILVGALDSYEARCRQCFDPFFEEQLSFNSKENEVRP
jgi:thymidine kinase